MSLVVAAREDWAVDIVRNAKVQRPSVCNAVETLLVHVGAAARLLPPVLSALAAEGVTVWNSVPALMGMLLEAVPEAERHALRLVLLSGDLIPVPLPDRGRALPESRFVVADTLVRFDHGSGTAAVLAGDPTSVSEALSGPQPAAEHPSSAASAATRRLPSRGDYERSVAAAKELTRLAVSDAARAAERQRELQVTVFGSEDAKEGAMAFVEKREPVWRGR